MNICDVIISARNRGLVHCGISSQPSPRTSELAVEFGLAGDPAKYKEIDVTNALRLLELVLNQDMAYGIEIMPADRATELATRFLDQFGTVGTRYYTNCEFLEPQDLDLSWMDVVWDPVTSATFDTGVLVTSLQGSGCLWIEDED